MSEASESSSEAIYVLIEQRGVFSMRLLNHRTFLSIRLFCIRVERLLEKRVGKHTAVCHVTDKNLIYIFLLGI